jgi:hypothetical protein
MRKVIAVAGEAWLLVRTRANCSPSAIRLLSLPLGLFDSM